MAWRNIGTDANCADSNGCDTDETFLVEQLDGTAQLGTVKVTAFGRSNTYTNVTSIKGNFGSGNDTVIVAPSVLLPVCIDGGTGNDSITDAGTFTGSSACNSLSGGAGDDYVSVTGKANTTINGGDDNDYLLHGGIGTVTINGGDGNDHLVGSSATDVLNGENGNDVLEGVGTTFSGGAGNDLMSSPSTGRRTRRWTAAPTPTRSTSP